MVEQCSSRLERSSGERMGAVPSWWSRNPFEPRQQEMPVERMTLAERRLANWTALDRWVSLGVSQLRKPFVEVDQLEACCKMAVGEKSCALQREMLLRRQTWFLIIQGARWVDFACQRWGPLRSTASKT